MGSRLAELFPPADRGNNGLPSATNWDGTRDSVTPMIPAPPVSTSLADDGVMAASHPLGSRLALEQRRTRYGMWARRFPCWGPTTRD
jgi:hypothetical protein